MTAAGGGGGDRAARMGRRLERELATAGFGEEARRRILTAYRLALELRRERLAPEDPGFLHPGRTVLILLTDVGRRPLPVFAAAPLCESEDAGLSVPRDRIEEALGSPIADLAGDVPLSGDPRLTERLVTSEPEVRLLALAERLDHLRHLHLADDPERLREAHREARDVYLPVAARVHAELERRIRWWCDRFEGF